MLFLALSFILKQQPAIFVKNHSIQPSAITCIEGDAVFSCLDVLKRNTFQKMRSSSLAFGRAMMRKWERMQRPTLLSRLSLNYLQTALNYANEKETKIRLIGRSR